MSQASSQSEAFIAPESNINGVSGETLVWIAGIGAALILLVAVLFFTRKN